MGLQDSLQDEAKRAALVTDCLQVLDDEVKDKSGLSGMAIKAGYSAVKGIKPGFVKGVVEGLLPEFAEALDPFHSQAKAAGAPVSQFFEERRGAIADSLLSITDGKAERSTNGIVKGTYKKLRGSAKKNVEAAVPRLAALIEKHA